MPRDSVYSAIDIGSSKITTLIASYSAEKGSANIIGVATIPSRGLRKSQIVDIEEVVGALTESVEAAERMAGISISQSVVSIGGANIASQNSKGVVAVAEPEVEITENDVSRVLEAAKAISLPSSREIIHVVPKNFIVDSQTDVKDPVGMAGVRLEAEAHIITASTTAIRNLVKCVNEIGIDVSNLVYNGLASSKAVLTDTEKELGVCLIDIGGGTTDVCVFNEGSLTSSFVLPVGASNVTNDLAIGLRVSLESAEKIKKFLSQKEEKTPLPDQEKDEVNLAKLGVTEEISTISKKTLIEGIIRPRVNEIFNMVALRLKEAALIGTIPSGVVLVGGGAKTVNIIDFCKRSLSMPARIGLPSGISGLVNEIESPEFSTSIGLILYASQETNFKTKGTSLAKFSKLFSKIPVKGIASKTIEFIKSFLP